LIGVIFAARLAGKYPAAKPITVNNAKINKTVLGVNVNFPNQLCVGNKLIKPTTNADNKNPIPPAKKQ
jgi:hypothetical protein